MEARLLRVHLPSLSLSVYGDHSLFFDDCEGIAAANAWHVDRRRDFTGLDDSSDQLNIHLGPTAASEPMLRMVSLPEADRVRLDVVSNWQSGGPEYDEYVDVAKRAYRALFREYRKTSGRQLRLGIPRKPDLFDSGSVDCGAVGYARPLFRDAVKRLAIGRGDARRRVADMFGPISVVRAESLPSPLDGHFIWVCKTLTRESPQWRGDTSVEATLRRMTNATASKVAERVYDIADALDEIGQCVCGEEPYYC